MKYSITKLSATENKKKTFSFIYVINTGDCLPGYTRVLTSPVCNTAHLLTCCAWNWLSQKSQKLRKCEFEVTVCDASMKVHVQQSNETLASKEW